MFESVFNKIKALRSKIFSDRADSILVPAMILLPVLALTAGIAIEVQKNNYVRSERINAIQDAASASISTADTRGSLNWSAVDRVVEEYEHIRFGQNVFGSSAANYNARKQAGDETDTANSKVFDGEGGCLVGHGDDEGQLYPQYRVTLLEKRGDTTGPTVTFVRSQPTVAQLQAMAPLEQRTIYRAIDVEVVDQVPNIVLGMVGMPCQKFTLNAGAVTFASNTDLS